MGKKEETERQTLACCSENLLRLNSAGQEVVEVPMPYKLEWQVRLHLLEPEVLHMVEMAEELLLLKLIITETMQQDSEAAEEEEVEQL